MFEHGFGVEIRDQKRNIIALGECQKHCRESITRGGLVYLDGLPPEDKEGLGALLQEPSEFMDQDMLDFIRLFYPNADANAVDTGFDENLLILVARNGQGVEKKLGGAGRLDLGDVVPLGCLRSEVGDS